MFSIGTGSRGESLKQKFNMDGIGPAGMPGVPEDVQRFDYTSGVDGLRDWGLVLPSSSDTWAVNIHGHGSGGDQIFTRPDLRDNWLPQIKKHGLGLLTFNLRGNAWMCPAAASDVHNILGFVRQKWDVKKFIFAGGSMGGSSNLIYAVVHPEDVAGVVALCPATDLQSYYTWCRKSALPIVQEIADAIERSYGGKPKDQPRIYSKHSIIENATNLKMPVFVCHGTADAFIPISQPRSLVGRMGNSTSFTYVEIPDGNHDAPLAAFGQGLDWVLRKTAQ